MLRFNYHHLYYFYMIAEEGSVTHAAKKLRLAQSSLSMQLGQFEAFLEKKLFLREGKKIFLTEDGIHVLSYAKAIFNLGDELADSLGDRARKGQLRIEIGVTNFVPKSFADTLLNFLYVQNEIPYIQLVEKNLTTMIKKLSVHKLDMILSDSAHKAPAEQGIQNHILAKIPVLLCGSKTLTSRVKRFPADLSKVPMILPTAQSRTYHALHDYFITHKIKPQIIAEIQDLELVRRLVLSGKGIAPINAVTIANAPSKEKLIVIKNSNLLKIYDTIYLIKKERKNPHPLVDKVIKSFKV
jgi:LysR family transcriptional activator of nhaA